MTYDDFKLATKGKWIGIFNNFGIPVKDNKHSPCPLCGGKDRFRFTDFNSDGDYYCNQCGSGNGVGLVMKYTGMEFKAACEEIKKILGTVDYEKPKDNNLNIKKILNKTWNESFEIKGGDPVMKYLHSRKIMVRPDNIKFNPKCYESDTKKEYPAMIARIQNSNGQPISLHRTYLNGAGKADIESPKKIMTATESLQGSAIRLFTPGDTIFSDGILGVSEGVETALSVSQLFGIATWSVLNTALMESFVPPKEYKEIVIFGDNDANFAGQKSAYILANRLYIAGLLVRVEIPEVVGDWNDILIKESI